MSIKLVAFDWNGTLLSDAIIACKADSAGLKHYGYPELSLTQFRNHFRIPIKDFWLSLGLTETFFDKNSEEIQKIFMAHYEPLEAKARTRSGAKEALKWLDDNQIKSAIFSNHPTGHIEKQTQRLGIDKYFYAILGRDLGNSHMHKRSKDAKLQALVESLKLKPSEVVTVGDTDEEIHIAKKYGYISVGLTEGYQSTAILRGANPDFLISNLTQLPKIISQL